MFTEAQCGKDRLDCHFSWIRRAFERWLAHNGIRRTDKVNLDSLVMYRLEVNSSQANLLLNHSDVRLVDLPPKSGIRYSQLNCDINRIPEGIQSPTHQAARVCVLDSGVNTNHPLLAPAIAESADFIGDTDGMDLNGHGKWEHRNPVSHQGNGVFGIEKLN